MLKKVVVFVFVLLSIVKAETIKKIEFVGLVHISDRLAKEFLDFSEGDELNVEKVDRSIKKFFSQGYFDDIMVTIEDGVLSYVFKEKPTIAKIEIKGVDEEKVEEIRAVLGYKKGDTYDKQKIEKGASNIIKYYESNGYFDTVAEAIVEKLTDSAVKITIDVNKGENIIIDKVTFCGLESFEYDDFKDQISNRQKEMLGWLWGFDDGKLQANELEMDAKRIENFYLTEGYLDVKVSEPFLRAYTNSYKAKLSYIIKEGKPYFVNSLKIFLNKPAVDEDLLYETLKLKVGKRFNVKKLRKDLRNLKRIVADAGYAYVKVVPKIEQDRKNNTANITYKIYPGEIVYIRNVKISGNLKTIDRAIRREMYLTEGMQYKLTDYEDSLKALRRTGYFDSVSIEKIPVGNNQMDLLVKVDEAATGSVSGGIGYSTSDGLLLNFNVSDRNMLGSGIEFGVDVQYSERELDGKIYFYNPRVYDSIYSFGGSLYRYTYDYYDYDEESYGGQLTLGRKFGRHWSGYLRYELESTTLDNFSSDFDSIYYREGTTWKSSLTPGLRFNNTDNYFLPRSGIIASAFMEYAGIGGDEKYIKSFGRLKYFKGLEDEIDYDLILRYKIQGGYVYDNGYLPINEKFYMGGSSTVRGYDSKSLSPISHDGTRIGGNTMIVNSFEANIPLIESVKLRASAFLDYGWIGEDDLSIDRGGTGAQLEWQSPMGQINIILAYPLNKKDGDKTSNFEFTMGRTF